jgi:uncharacterized coiled-coil protein SlyX
MDSKLMTSARKWMHISPFSKTATENPGAFVKWCDQTFGINKFLVPAGPGGIMQAFGMCSEGAPLDRNFPFCVRYPELNEVYFGGGHMCVKIEYPERLPMVFAFIFEKMNELETRDKELHQRMNELEQQLEEIHTDMKKQKTSLDFLLEKILEDECDDMFNVIEEVEITPCVGQYLFDSSVD